MNNLRIKLMKGDTLIEVEGEKEVVENKFNELKDLFFSTDTHLSQVQIQSNPTNTIIEAVEIPLRSYSLKDIILKDLPNSEKEWVLIYSYFLSNNGTDFFRRDAITKMYEDSKRRTTSRINNLSNNIKYLVSDEYLRFINDDDIAITHIGLNKIEEIFDR